MDPEFLKILACPLSGGSLEYDPERCELISAKAGVAYPVLDGIPVLCIDAARPLAGEPDPSPPPIMAKEAKAKGARRKEAKRAATEEDAGGAVAEEKPPVPSETDPETTPG